MFERARCYVERPSGRGRTGLPERGNGNEKGTGCKKMKPRQKFLIKAQSLIFSTVFI